MDTKARRALIRKLGGPTRVAEMCGCTPQAVGQWYRPHRAIPNGWLRYFQILRPDLFEAPSKTARKKRGARKESV